MFVARDQVAPKYRLAIIMSGIVTGIAAYHYFRIFNSFDNAFTSSAVHGSGNYNATEHGFNEGYRYVDWLLTVPLLLAETIAVLALPIIERRNLLYKLIPASALMIALGYPGEISADHGVRALWGDLSTLPFLFILYVLFVELGKSLRNRPEGVRVTVRNLRLILIATWGVYPIAYLTVQFGVSGADAWVLKQAGYSIADVLAKCVFGLMIFKIARMKSAADELEPTKIKK